MKFFILSLVLLSGCNIKINAPQEVCKSVFKATTSAANIIASTLQCENTAAIAGDISDKIVGLGLCAETSQQSTLSDVICPQISTLIASMATNSIPKNWGCSATVVTDILKAQMQENCSKVIK
jgi:hypothetical protein